MFNWLPIGGAIGRKMLYGPAVCGRWIIVFEMSDSPLLSLAALVIRCASAMLSGVIRSTLSK